MNLLVKSGSRDLNRLDEPKIERETQRRIMGPCAAAASIVHSIKHNTSISTRCQRGDCQSMWREKEKKQMWSKMKIRRMLQRNSCRQKPDVLSSIQRQGKLVKADSVCIFFGTKNHYTALPWFSFSSFYILLFSVHIVNVNTAKSGTGLDNLRVNIYLF